MANLKFACALVLLCFLVMTAPTACVITCGQVISAIATCLSFFTKGGLVPPSCCIGVQSLNVAAQTTPDRQTVCNCLKNTVSKIPGFNAGNAAVLPGRCGVSIPYNISTSTNCATIKF